MPDIASAARRVAEDMTVKDSAAFLCTYAATAEKCGDNSKLARSIQALLPIFDAVAAGQSDEGRVERRARRLDPELWAELDLPVPMRFIGADARDASLKRAAAAMAVADAERVAAAVEGWKVYEKARDTYREALWARATLELRMTRSADARLAPIQAELDAAEAALDAAVRRLAGTTVDRDAMARRLMSLHGADLKDMAHAKRHLDYVLDGGGDKLR